MHVKESDFCRKSTVKGAKSHVYGQRLLETEVVMTDCSYHWAQLEYWTVDHSLIPRLFLSILGCAELGLELTMLNKVYSLIDNSHHAEMTRTVTWVASTSATSILPSTTTSTNRMCCSGDGKTTPGKK